MTWGAFVDARRTLAFFIIIITITTLSVITLALLYGLIAGLNYV